jgi:MoaA/NifB/PqqE/SkfB family radical SAM enzyme
VKAYQEVGYACNGNCTFCHTADMRHIDDTAERVDWKISAQNAQLHDGSALGREPTMRPELRRWARKTAALGLDFGLVTNGLMLIVSPRASTGSSAIAGSNTLYMSLHGGTPRCTSRWCAPTFTLRRR